MIFNTITNGFFVSEAKNISEIMLYALEFMRMNIGKIFFIDKTRFNCSIDRAYEWGQSGVAVKSLCDV